MQKKKLNDRDKARLSRWFNKVDEHTIELRDKRWGMLKFTLFLFMLIHFYWGFMHPEYRANTISSLRFTFMPSTRFESSWQQDRDRNNPRYDLIGRTKEEYMVDMWEAYKGKVKTGYLILLPYVLFALICLWPAKRRFRFDRRRGIIYTYAKGKLYVTEINKLMRPLSEYLVLRPFGLAIWIHPYDTPVGLVKLFTLRPLMSFAEIPMWIHGFTRQFQYSPAFFMQEAIVDFMNPDTDPAYLHSMLEAIDQRPDFFTSLFTWIDMGLYCKRLPKQAVLEKALAQYFVDAAPKIKAHPSWIWPYKTQSESRKSGMFDIISVEENRQAGYGKVPCPTLFEFPQQSMHYESDGSLEPYREKYAAMRAGEIEQEELRRQRYRP